MGLSLSLLWAFGGKIYCESHGSEEAAGFCLSHKVLICMTCLIEKVHFGVDCNILEIAKMNHEMKECLIMKQNISTPKKKVAVNQRQTQMFQEIEKAYSKARENLEKLRLAHHEIARQEITNMYEREAETFNKLYRAIDCYNAGNKVDGDNIKNKVLLENFGNKLFFEKVNPAFSAIERSLEDVREVRPTCTGRLPRGRELQGNVVGSDCVRE